MLEFGSNSDQHTGYYLRGDNTSKGVRYMKSWQCTQMVFSVLLLAVGLGYPGNTAEAQEVKWLKIGDLQSWFRADAIEPEVGRTGLQADQQDGMIWPAQFHGPGKRQDNMAAKALWIGTTNYKDAAQYGGNTYPRKVVHVGPRGWDTEREFMPIEFLMYGRYDHPAVYVDDLPGTDLMWNDVVDVVDESIIADRMIRNVVNTSIGVTVTRKIYGWGQQYHDDYFIEEYVFKNTGNVDPDEEIEQPDKTLENVQIFFQYRFAVSREGADGTGLNSPRWGINAMLSTRGEAASDTSAAGFTYPGDYEEWLNGNSGADSIRAQFAWAGRHSGENYNMIGYPDVSGGTGRLQGPQFIGVATLYADASPSTPTDDPQQPTTTTYQQSDDPPTRPNDQFDATRMTEEWKWMTKGHRLPRHSEAVGNGFPDQFEGTPGGFSNMNGYGPYRLTPGDSIRLVVAPAVGGINRELCRIIGENWLNETGNYTLPDGSSTTDKDEYKNAWVFTGKDSLFNTFGRARQNFELMEQGQPIAMPPSPPPTFQVNSGGDRITLSWSTSPDEGTGSFGGYEVYRAVASYDTTFDKVFECGPSTSNPEIVYEYEDKSVVRGFAYYYYIVTRDDGTNPTGNVLRSSLFWTRTIEPAYLRRPAGQLGDIRIVPNPYNLRAQKLQFPSEPDKIMFYNIPGECTIKIFTERGDLIKTIEHRDGSGDEPWNSTTEYGQVIVSGVYIAVIETPSGEKAIRKFVVIR